MHAVAVLAVIDHWLQWQLRQQSRTQPVRLLLATVRNHYRPARSRRTPSCREQSAQLSHLE